MDIRNFFGGSKPKAKEKKVEEVNDNEQDDNKEVKSSNTIVAAAVVNTKRKGRRIIEDDDDDDELEFGSEIVTKPSEVLKAHENKKTEEKVSSVKGTNPEPSPVTSSKSQVTEKKNSQRASIFSVAKKSDQNAASSSSSSNNTNNNNTADAISTTEDDAPLNCALTSDLVNFITWKPLAPVPYAIVAGAFDQVGATSSRLEKEAILAKLFRAVALTTPADLEHVVYLTSNTVYPAYAGLELGIGDALLVKAVVEATGRNRAAVQAAYKEQGDLGIVACQSRQNQSTLSFGAKPKALTARLVLEQLRLITNTTGGKSMDRKVGIIKKMMVACQGDEAKYIVRALQGKLRIGIAMQTVLVGLAHAFATPTAEQIALSRSLEGAEGGVEEKQEQDVGMGVVQDSDEDEDEEVEVEGEQGKREDADGAAIVDTLKDQFALTDEEKLDAQSASGNEKLRGWVSSLSCSAPEEASRLKNASKHSCSAHRRPRQLSKEERDECAVVAVKRAFSECPSLDILANTLLAHPIYDIYKHCLLTPGVPVAPMLAKPTKQIAEVLKRLNGLHFTMEYKYDGERAQVHLLSDGSVKIFSRNSEDNSQKFPEFLDVFRQAKRGVVTDCVVDAEVVAYDRERRCLLPFQVLSTRKRKVEDGEEEQKVKVILQAFDLIYLNGKSLLQQSLLERRNLLHASFVHSEGFFHFASGVDHLEDGDTTPIEVFMQEACQAMCEGLMVKTLSSNATYDPSKRSMNWLKLKKDYIDGMGVCDSVDLVVIGGYYGRGKRTSVYGAYLMACYDPESDEFQSVCKVGTGFKDEDLSSLFAKCKEAVSVSGRKPSNYNVGDPLTPDDWFEPKYVWELQAADLSKSSVHKGGIGRVDAGRGIGLRFPRFLRERPDKKPEMATTAEQIVEIYESQGDMFEANSGKNDDDDDDELL